MKNYYVIDYLNENNFRQLERGLKKYNMLAYKKLIFEFYPAFREGIFEGNIVFENKEREIFEYELKLPMDNYFSKIHGDVLLHYTVYENQKTVILNSITPGDILLEVHQKELTTYKGIPVSKSHAEKDMFKINLLNMLNGNGGYSSSYSNSNYSNSIYKSSSYEKKSKVKVSDRKECNSMKKEVSGDKSSKSIRVKNKVPNVKMDEYLVNWEEGLQYFNSVDDSLEKANEDIKYMEKLLDNSFENIDFCEKKFKDFVIVYLSKADGSFVQIKNAFVNYLLKRNKDEVLVYNIKLLKNEVKFDLNIMKWLKELVDKNIVSIYSSLYNESLQVYQLNEDKLDDIQKAVLKKKKKAKKIIILLFIIYLIILIVFNAVNNTVINSNVSSEIYDLILDDALDSYSGNIHSLETTKYLKCELEDTLDYGVRDLINLIYKYRNIVFVDSSAYMDGNYYIQMSDDFYNNFILKLDEEYIDYVSSYYTSNKNRGNILCNDRNSFGGISYFGNYKVEYVYNTNSSDKIIEMNYYIYHWDGGLLYNGISYEINQCDDVIKTLLDDYLLKYKDYFISEDRRINVELENKTISFYDKNGSLEFKMYTEGYTYSKNIIALEWEGIIYE